MPENINSLRDEFPDNVKVWLADRKAHV